MAAQLLQGSFQNPVNIDTGATPASASLPNGFYILSVVGVPAYVGTGSNAPETGVCLPVGTLPPLFYGEAPQGYPVAQSKIAVTASLVWAQASGSGNGQVSFMPCNTLP